MWRRFEMWWETHEAGQYVVIALCVCVCAFVIPMTRTWEHSWIFGVMGWALAASILAGQTGMWGRVPPEEIEAEIQRRLGRRATSAE